MAITLDEMRKQCRIDDTDDDDQLTGVYLPAAIRGVESRINRLIYDDAVPEGDDTGLVLDGDIKLAVLMLVGHFYENREATASGAVNEIPLALSFLIDPWRLIAL
ncbi:phage gp6-like head-tail connector protein [Salmonella enterica]|uniref:Phage gp6-like head-tail connector protein n=1 Tax=Salmonella enterica TaxID=28901 RepID=A0A762BYS6_SALER|nr:phage gp6-like head-tail connector protein [Salmonella enterica]EIS0682970.1 phage gp6-like head-tail connector protein [Salmonella enterica]HAG3504810.1 phage gp6-like head-tail connector protein [Salmonella enterica]